MDILKKMTEYNVTWKSPSKSDRGYMPLGNGDGVMNLWIEENDDLQFYFTTQDALNERDSCVKMGKIRLSIEPNPFSGKNFTQTLNIADGCVDIAADGVTIKAFVGENNVIYINCASQYPINAKATYLNWRINEDGSPNSSEACSGFDTYFEHNNGIVFYHRNIKPMIEWCVEKTDLSEECVNLANDMLTYRIFGGYMTMSGGESSKNTISVKNTKKFLLKISMYSEQNENVEEFIKTAVNINETAANTTEAFAESSAVWNAYWKNSYVFIEGDKYVEAKYSDNFEKYDYDVFDDGYHPQSYVTNAYIYTKYMFQANSKGKHPLRFNALNFVTNPAKSTIPNLHFWIVGEYCSRPLPDPTKELNPDMRPWGDLTLWQNIRHPYKSMLARAEYENIKVVFDFYMAFAPLNRQIAKEYYNAEGQFNTEITTSFGTYNPGVYGLDRNGLPKGYSQNRYGGAVDISPGLELVYLMLDFCDYTEDFDYRKNVVLPYLKELLIYIKTRFNKRENGKIVLYPLHAVETYWDTKNPITVVGGMHSVLDRVLAFEELENRDFFEEMKKITPDIPFREINGRKIVAVAEEYEDIRRNVESPELYMLYPFKYYGYGKADFDMICELYEEEKEKNKINRPFIIGKNPSYSSYSGWQYISECAAIMRKSEDVREILENNCGLFCKAYRFPAIWGPCYDSAPDVDHGGVLLSAIQLSLLQFDGDKIYLLPSLPEGWNAKFKLYAPKNTCIECEYENGSIKNLSVTPKHRLCDVIFK